MLAWRLPAKMPERTCDMTKMPPISATKMVNTEAVIATRRGNEACQASCSLRQFEPTRLACGGFPSTRRWIAVAPKTYYSLTG